ncbi:30S ribosomal protein S20 [Desulfosarcina sp.]|uniref:30S ribosomal protein S20 n=1 Tax=Desulfosarcina sp. TaxID=2027861 RepID=UPI00356707CC
MANHKSALKRAGQNERRRLRNKAVQTRVKNVVKDVRLAVAQGTENAVEQLNAAKSAIDKAAKKGVLHKKTASRKVSRLNRQVNAQQA